MMKIVFLISHESLFSISLYRKKKFAWSRRTNSGRKRPRRRISRKWVTSLREWPAPLFSFIWSPSLIALSTLRQVFVSQPLEWRNWFSNKDWYALKKNCNNGHVLTAFRFNRSTRCKSSRTWYALVQMQSEYHLQQTSSYKKLKRNIQGLFTWNRCKASGSPTSCSHW